MKSYKQAFEGALHDIVLTHAKERVRDLTELVQGSEVSVRHYDQRHQDNYEEVWKADHLRAKRELARERKELKLWKERLRALKVK